MKVLRRIKAFDIKYSNYFFILLLVVSIQMSSQLILDNLLFKAILASIITFFWILLQLFREKKMQINYSAWFLFTLLFSLYFVVGIFWANTFTLSFLGISKLILFYTLFLFICSLLNRDDTLFFILIKGIILAFLLSLITFSQQLFQLNEFTYTSIYSLTGISGHKNLYSSFIYLTTIGSFIGLQYFKTQKKWRLLIVVTLILQIFTILILRTRAVWLGFVISVFIYFIFNLLKKIRINPSKIWLHSILLSSIATVLIAYLFPEILKWYISIQQQSLNIAEVTDLGTFSERVKVWIKTFEIFKENPIWGVGNGNWKIDIVKYSLPEIYKVQDLNVIFQRPHNVYLRILSENGIIGLFLFMYLISFFSLSLLKKNTYSGNTAKFIFSGFIGLYVIMFFSFPLERIEHCIVLTFLLSLSYSIRLKVTNGKSLNYSRKYLLISFLACGMVAFFFQSRFKSSYYLKKMYFERNIGNNEKVIAFCDSAITSLTKVDDFSIPIHWYRGNANANMKDFKKALKDLKCALIYNPYNANVLNDLGSAFMMNENSDSAIFYYEKSVKINPRFDDPKLNLVAIYLDKLDFKKANKWEKEIFHDSDRRNYYIELLRQVENRVPWNGVRAKSIRNP